MGQTAGARLWGGRVLVVSLLAMTAEPVSAQAWQYVRDARLLTFGPEQDVFTARCRRGEIAASYYAHQRPKIRAGLANACGAGQRPCLDELPVTVLVDGQGVEIFASARPEEMSGGFQIIFHLEADDPLWARMARGRTLSMRIAGQVGERLPLAGVADPLRRLLAACRR